MNRESVMQHVVQAVVQVQEASGRAAGESAPVLDLSETLPVSIA